MEQLGVIAALGSCMLWAWSATHFQPAVRRWGPFSCGLFKTLLATILFGVTALALSLDKSLPLGSPGDGWALALSGFVGMALGDWALLAAIGHLGVRQAMLIHGTSPVFLLLWSVLGPGAPLGGFDMAGIVLVVTGVSMVTVAQGQEPTRTPHGRALGILFGFLAAIGQAAGILIAKDAFTGFHVISASGIRLAGALTGLLAIQLLRGRIGLSLSLMVRREVWSVLFRPAFVGTYLGVLLMMTAIDNTPAAIAGALLSTTPLFVIPFAFSILGERTRWPVLLGTAVAVAGVATISALS
ncbi:MAG TPA: DMT family transporter [Planctomycetes bacterium]|nr:DMT family transporter [Planctomycetota bacterium]